MKRYITVSERKRKTAKRRQRKAAKYQVSCRVSGTRYTVKGKHNRPVVGPDMLEQIKSGKPMAPTYRLMAINFEPHLPECMVSTILLGVNASPVLMLPRGKVEFRGRFGGRVECFETALFSSDDTIINRRFTYGDSKDLHMLIATAYLMNAHADGKELPPALAAILDKYSKPARYASEYKRLYQKIKPFFDTTIA